MSIAAVAAAAFALAAAPASAAPRGEKVFSSNCAFCHQAGGVGVPGQFPRLEGRVGTIAASPEGRQFLVTLLLSGMSGHVKVDGQDILGLMPGFATMSDADLAAVLTYISHLGKTKAAPFTQQEIVSGRSRPVLAPDEVAVQRANLATQKIVP